MTAAPGPRSRRPRSAANYGPQRGTTYLIHIDPPYKHAKHYKGWTDRPVEQRLADHLAGRGALLTRLAVRAGSRLTLARVWPDTTKDREDSIKRQDGKRMCPECGVKPAAPRLASDKPPAADDRRPMWMADRDGQWNDGTPIIYDPDQTWAQARAARAAMQIPEPGPAAQAELAALDELQRQWTNQEDQVGLRDAAARAAAAVRGRREAHAQRAAGREADRLWALADELERRAGPRPNYQREITAERAARMRARLGEDLVQDARAQRGAEARAHEPDLQGAERDAEIDRLAAQFAELEPVFGPRPDGTYAGAIDSDIAADDGIQSDPYSDDLSRERYWAALGGVDAEVEEAGAEPGDDAATWSPGLEDEEAAAHRDRLQRDLDEAAADAETQRREERAALAREHLMQDIRTGRNAEHSPEFASQVRREQAARVEAAARHTAAEARDARREAEADAYRAAAALQDLGGREAATGPQPEPMHRMAPEAGHSPAPAPIASAQPPGTTHTDPELAERGWAPLTRAEAAARDPDLAEIFDRVEELAAEARDYETAANLQAEAADETGAPDHLHGSPGCAEADAEGAHFGRGPGEPMDTGRWPVLQADYGRMYIGPQYEAEAI